VTRGPFVILVAVAMAAPANAAVRVVAPFPPERYAGSGAIGLAVPGAGPTVTREAARRTLLTGKVASSLIGGPKDGAPLITLDEGPPPDTLVVLPPAGKTENDRYPIAVSPGPRGVLTSDSTRIEGLVSLADVANGDLRVVSVADPVATLARLQHRIERNDRIRLPLTVLAGAIAYLCALFAPGFAPRILLVALAANLWLAGWWVVAVVALAGLVLPLGAACAAVLAAYLLVLGFDPESVALSPFGPSQAGRFYGVSNLLETMLLVPALLGAARLGRAGIAVGALALVTVAGSRFGADGGGLIVLLAAYATLVLRTAGARLGAARLALVGIGAVALGVLLVGVDAALGGSSHVTHAVGDGPGALLGDLADRLEISARRTFDAFGPAFAALASLAVVVFVASRRPRGPLTDAILVGIVVSLLVNDTPGDVLGMGAVGAFVLWRYERRAPHDTPAWGDRLRAMRRPAIVLALAVAALALGLVAAGCSEGDVSATPETVEGTLPQQTAPGGNEDLPASKLKGDATAGKAVFESAGCTACHTLSAAGSTGTVGPNLDQAKPSFDLVVHRVTLGQGGMPSFKDQLQPQQIADVAEFVSSSAGG
jgi:mono/diheme cytochrome c family protein